jgi:DNA modification methylase
MLGGCAPRHDRRGEVVLDPFLGSGSTVLAAEKTGRTCRGVEIDPRYVDVVLRRFEAARGSRRCLCAPDRAGDAERGLA